MQVVEKHPESTSNLSEAFREAGINAENDGIYTEDDGSKAKSDGFCRGKSSCGRVCGVRVPNMDFVFSAFCAMRQ